MPAPQPSLLTSRQRWLALAAAFLGWMFAGMEMSIFPLATDAIIRDFHASGGAASEASAGELKLVIGKWFTWYIAAFLLGAAAGGLLFGWLGDRIGRASAMGWSVLCYSLLTGAGYLATSPEQLLALRFLACMGIGGIWPNGVALVNEAWPGVSRPTLAGLIGAAANVGMTLLGAIIGLIEINPQSWRWVMLLGAAPAALGALILTIVPESPRWIALRSAPPDAAASAPRSGVLGEVFTPPLLWRTVVGILLGTIPLLGAWGANKWILLWAEDAGAPLGDYTLKGQTQFIWGIGAVLGSLAGGWLASGLGRRTSYFLISLASLTLAFSLFRWAHPSREFAFMAPVFLLGVAATTFFGWLPLYLPELFATRVRATGAGVSFNFGRIVSAAVILSTGWLVQEYRGAYERVGGTTSLIYLAGLLIVFFMPSSTDEELRS